MKTVSKDLKIEIRPIPGRNGIEQFSKNLQYFSQAHTLHPFVNPVSRNYDTGLSEDDKKYLTDNKFPYNIEEGYIRGVSHEFWESRLVKVELKNNPIFLFPGQNLIDFVKWKYLLVNSYIYSSEEEMKSETKPEATHYIYNEADETTHKASALQMRNSLIREVGELSLKRKRDIVLIILDENTDNKTEDYLTVKFDEIMNGDKAPRLKELLSRDTEDVSLAAEIKSAIHKNALRKTKQGIFFFETNLGFNEDDVKTFLSKDENQEILIAIKAKL